jgi:MtN3 and saliva related transmembrane protein
MFIDTDHLGFLAATLTTISFIPQVWLVWRQRSAAGISAGMYCIFTLGVALWLAYGIMIASVPVIIANGITLLLAASILVMKWKFDRP